MIHLSSDYPSPFGVERRNAFPRLAAIAALAAPVLAIAAAKVSSILLKDYPELVGGSFVLGLGLVSFLLLIAGLILGILALLLMKPGGGRSIIFPAAAGVLICGLLLAFFVPHFVRARYNGISERKSREDFNRASRDLSKPAGNAMKDGGTPEASTLVQPPATASQTAAGTPAAILKGSSAFLQRLQTLQADWANASKDLAAADVLRGRDLTEREQLQARKASVQKFLEASAAARDYLKQSEENYRAELARQNVPPAELDAAVDGFHNSDAAVQPLVVEISRTDSRIGEALLRLLGLLDASWGEWRYDSAKNRKVFKSAEALEHYNACMQEIADARKDQDLARKKLVALASQAASAL